MSEHERFEELSALAAIGQLSAEELRELNQHLRECGQCREAASDFKCIVESEMPLLKDRESFWNRFNDLVQPDKHTRRFLATAKARGFSFSEEIERNQNPRIVPLRFETVAIAALVLVTISFGFVALRWKHAYDRVSAERYELRQPVQSQSDRDALLARLNDQADRISEMQKELSVRKEELDAALARTSKLGHQRDLRAENEQRLKATADAEAVKNAELSSQLEAGSQRIAALNDEVQKLSNLRGADVIEVAAQQKRVDELSQQLQAQTEMLSSERQLLSAGRDIRDLMGARNLHIIDVFDTDQKGRNKKAFGRVFYTEGKSLIFYAFDLSNDRVVDAKYSYQAWGVRDGAGGQAKSLGVFYIDDKDKRRWVLKSEDPAALAQIDSVFVTVEPFGGAKQPTGQKFLYAFLKNQANHP
jgi:hypothetical protein